MPDTSRGSRPPLPTLDLSLSPLGETAMVLDRDRSVDLVGLKEFATNVGMQEIDVDGALPGLIVLSNLDIKRGKSGLSYLFGGRSFSESGQLVVRGDGRVPESGKIDSVDDIFGTTGEFHLLEIGAGVARLSADYFGIQQLFQYDDGHVYAVATSYHLLLKIIRSLNLPAEIDYERSRRILDEGKVFHSRVSIDVLNCSILAIYEHIEIDSDGPRVIQSDLHDTLYKRQDFSEERYATLIAQARDEIVRNMQMIFECPELEAVVVDLSGGMDSRLLYAACTHLPQALVRPKIQINCQHAPSPSSTQGGDLEVALELNSIWKYQMLDNDNPVRRWTELWDEKQSDDVIIAKLSRLFGTHKNYNHIVPKHVSRYCTNVARVSGFIGECYRAADSQNLRMATSYINHRNRYMTSRAFENILTPLASKSALSAAFYYQRNHPSASVQRTVFDLLIALNPLLAKVRFHNEPLRAFVESEEFETCLNFPAGVTVNVESVENPRPTQLTKNGGDFQIEEFVFEETNVEKMMERIVRYNPDYADIVARVDPSTAARNNTTVYRLWNLYFAIDTIDASL